MRTLPRKKDEDREEMKTDDDIILDGHLTLNSGTLTTGHSIVLMSGSKMSGAPEPRFRRFVHWLRRHIGD